MNKIQIVGIASALLTLAGSVAMADTAASQNLAAQIHRDRAIAAHQEAHSARAMANGNTAYANRLDTHGDRYANRANQLYHRRRDNRMDAARRLDFHSMRDEQRADYYANHGQPGKATYWTNRSNRMDNRSDRKSASYGKPDTNDQTH